MADIRQIKVGNNTYDISAAWGNIIDKPGSYPPSTHMHNVSDISDIYTKENKLGYYDTITASADRTYTITRQTGYLTIKAEDITSGATLVYNSGAYTYSYDNNKISNALNAWNNIIGLSSNGMIVKCVDAYWIENNTIGIYAESNKVILGFSTSKTQAEIQALCPIYIQYKLATATTEKVEKDHYARYNEHFILEHNKQEAERSANIWNEEWEVGDFYWNSGEPATNAERYRSKSFSRIKPSTSYFISSPNIIEVLFYDSSKNYIHNRSYNNTSFVTPNNAYYFKICNTASNVYNNDIMLVESDKPLPYQPYEGNIIHEKELVDNYAKKTDIPTKTSQLTNDSNFLNSLPDRLSQYKAATENTPYYNGFYYFNNTGDASAKTAFDSYAQASTWVSAYNDNWAGQIGISYYSDNIAFRRKQGSSTWGNWIGIATKPWVDKQLSCNLGYYDTVVENDDGSYTITRQTGYLKLDGVKNKFDYKMGSTINAEYAYTSVINYISKPSNTSAIADIVSNTLKTLSADGLYSQNTYGIAVDTGGVVLVGLTTAIDTLDKANAYLAQNPVYIQYKLATATTERVEKNHYARYNESFILEHNKNEAKKSTNLFNNPYNYTATQNGVSINIVGNECVLNGTSTSGFYNVIGSFTLKAGTYTFNQVILSGSMSGSMTLAKFGLYKDTSLFPLDMLSGTYTLTEDTTLSIVVWFNQAELTFNNYKLTYMLNEGTTALPYQPYEGKVIHEKDLSDKLTGYVDTSTRQEINALKRFNSGVALKRDDTGIFQTDDGANLAIKSFGKDLHFYGKSGVENYVANAVLSFPYSGENNSYVYNFPNKSGTIALTTDLDPIKNDLTKNEYNLGAYDTISGNVITRQTGYVDLETLEWQYSSEKSYFYVAYAGIIEPSAYNIDFDGVTSKYKTTSWSDMNSGQDKSICYVVGYIRIKDTSYTDVASFKRNLQGVILQYKLATSYTEEIIEGQPLITLDQQGSQWLRDEWEKGLNVWDEQWEVGSINSATGDDLIASDRMRSKNYIKVSTYTLYITIENFSNVFCYDNNKSFLGVATYTKKGVGYVLNLKNNTSYIRFNTNTTYGATYKNDIAIFEGDHPYPYQAYNSKTHITNYEADFLKTEHDRSSNLWYKGDIIFGGEHTEIFKKCEKGIHTLRITSSRNTTYGEFHWYIRDLTTDTLILDGILPNNSYTLNVTQEMIDHDVRMWAWGTTSNDICKVMLNEGTTPLPYQPYEGKVVHEKELDGYAKSIYGVSQLYKHDIQFDILNGDGVRCTFWSTSNVKITDFSQIPYLAFSNIQVKNITNDKILNVVQWNSDGFRFYESDSNVGLIGDGYDGVTSYYINSVSQL